MEVTMSLLVVVFTIAAFFVYHSIFNVVYFSAQGCFTEIIICVLVGYTLALLCMHFFLNFWKIILLVVVIIAIAMVILKNKKEQ